MSRTHKDTPYWVKTKKEKFHAKWTHRPYLIGGTYYGSEIVRDERGKVVYQPVTQMESFPKGYYADDVWINYWEEVEVTRYVPVTQRVLVRSYKPYCTCGMESEEPHGAKINVNACYKVLTRAVERNPYSETYPDEHDGSTKKARQTFKAMKNAYNSTMDVDVLDDDAYSSVYSTKPPLTYVH